MTQPNDDAFTERSPLLETMPNSSKPLLVDRTDELETGREPTANHLADTVAFSPADGTIWLCGQRMLLMQSSAFGTMRRELIDALGLDAARGLLMRIGWRAGSRDAAQVSQQWPDADGASLFSAGPKMHMLEGMVNVEPVTFEIDNAIGHFYAEFIWHNSLEADEHINSYGISKDPACWMQVGYAGGYASSLMGQLVIFREEACHACGDGSCRIVGKPVTQWENPEQELADLQLGAVTGRDYVKESDSVMELAAAEAETQGGMVGISTAFIAAKHLLQRVAPTQATVLLTGESGVGKELFARTLHEASRRRDQSLVALNCATLPENLLEAELFGVEKGAYTGADRSREGRFERAHGGTLFLDEIATLSLSAQSKILRALQEGEIERMGGSRTINVDVRVIAATNVDLRDEVEAGRFREDLFYRLNVFPIRLPPLRERREDIPLLMNYFLRRFCERHERTIRGFTTRLVNTLLAYSFPGNIRELQNLIERGVIIAEGDTLDINHVSLAGSERLQPPAGLTAEGRLQKEERGRSANKLEEASGAITEDLSLVTQLGDLSDPLLLKLQDFVSGVDTQLGTSLQALEELLVRQAVERANGNLTAAAQMLGMSRAQVSYRLKGR